jgi:site-specific DNA-cytosine methylase
LRGDTKKGKPKRQSASRTLTEGIGGDGAIVNAIGASIYHKSTVVNQDVNCGHLVTENIAEPYVKSRRAQTSTDDETWVHGEVNPTLNSFDVGDTRATTAIVEPVLFENSYRDGARISNHGVTQTLSAKMGTGGGNTPMIALPTYSFDTQFGSNANVTENVSPTLKSSQQSPSVAYPIQDGRDMEKHQNGFGVASDGEPSYTLDQTGAQAVAYSVREDAKANTFSATELDHANALSALRPSPQSHHAQMFIAQPMAVRRLTPLECERLMGWPDDHTRFKADGTEQADTHRYKQCGNGVASPVAKWVASHIAKVENAEG